MDETIKTEPAANLLERFHNAMPVKAEATGLNRSTDQVSRAMQTYVDDGRISEDGHTQLVWLFTHGKVDKGYTSWDDIGKLVGYGGSTISRLFAGKYEGALDKVVSAVESYRHLNAERVRMSSDQFIETSIWTKIRDVCDLALIRNAPVRIVGVSQIGKTHALEEYRRRAKCNVFYFRVPAAPSFRNFMKGLSVACGVNGSLREEELRTRVPAALSRQTLLMVDELHELALSAGKGTAMKCMEWLREIYDVSHCGLAVCGTKSMEEDLINASGLKGWLDQFDQRCIRKLVLPSALPDADLALAAAAYGFPAPDASVENLLKTMRMNRLCTVFNLAIAAGRKRGEPLTWDLFQRTYKHNFGG